MTVITHVDSDVGTHKCCYLIGSVGISVHPDIIFGSSISIMPLAKHGFVSETSRQVRQPIAQALAPETAPDAADQLTSVHIINDHQQRHDPD